ncbi:MAG: glycoside hydrolase family 38 C-terminal domain-containing protein, partial [Promethearchaeota archaeon]
LNQFHDILPGSSIPEVYIRTWREHKFIIKSMKLLISKFLEPYLKSGNNSIYNPLPISNSVNIPVNSSYIRLNSIPPFSLQQINLAELKETDLKKPLQIRQFNKDIICSNQYYIAIFGRNDGNLKEFFWKNDEDSQYHSLLYSNNSPISNLNLLDMDSLDTLNKNKGARVKIYHEDFKGNSFPAWNICKNYTQHPIKYNCEKVEITINSQTCIHIKSTFSFLNSSFIVTYKMFHNSPMLDIQTIIDLKDKEVLMKHFFPINLKSNEVNCESQFGTVIRTRVPTTKMEAAKWEFSMHKWVDISDENRGLSILNKDRYGASANKKGLSVTLVRSPPYPSDIFYSHEKLFLKNERPSHTDLMEHHFSYALYPHKNSWKEENIPVKALAYNLPCFFFPTKDFNAKTDKKDNLKLPKFPNITISEPNVILSALKPGEWMKLNEKNGKEEHYAESKKKEYILSKNAEHWKWDGNHIILRVYEAIGKKGVGIIKFNDFSSNFNIKSVEQVDLLERMEKTLKLIENNQISFKIAPFEILTFRVIFGE